MSEIPKPPVSMPLSRVKIVDIDLPFGALCKLTAAIIASLVAVLLAIGGALFMLSILAGSIG